MQTQIEVIGGDIKQAIGPEQRFPVVLANLIARILADNAEAIASHVGSPGIVIASGIIEEREQLVLDAFSRLGFSVTDRRQARDWVALRLERS
jgi:ribosomal protein L11 methyltransferase